MSLARLVVTAVRLSLIAAIATAILEMERTIPVWV